MPFVKKISIENFMCFRSQTVFDFSQATFLLGPNNAGKSATLLAIRYFFDESLFSNESFLNKAVFVKKGAKFNRSKITVSFDLTEVLTKALRQRLIKQYGDTLDVSKIITFRIATKRIIFEYEINGKKYTQDNLNKDILKLIESVRLTYLHPQQGTILLKEAQKKLKDRLLLNWGRRGDVTTSMQEFIASWEKLRNAANSYLSKSLTKVLAKVMPGSVTKINLPRTVEEIIAISDITFQGDKTLSEVDLSAQGVGAQSLVLYFTHYLLDSDRSMHGGEYHPLWLLEEPESFLHADLAYKLGNQLNSSDWLDNIQMITSTHSSIILATSRKNQSRIQWNLINNHSLEKGKPLNTWEDAEIKRIGECMGDPNFFMYFLASSGKDLVFIEDKRGGTKKVYCNSGINVERGLAGVTEVAKYMSVMAEMSAYLINNVYFLIDNDLGAKNLERFQSDLVMDWHGFRKYKVSEKVFLIVFPVGAAVEDLFEEFDNYLEECLHILFKNLLDGAMELADSAVFEFSRTYVELRGKTIHNKEEAKARIKNTQDVKDGFWKKVADEGLVLSKKDVGALKRLLKK